MKRGLPQYEDIREDRPISYEVLEQEWIMSPNDPSPQPFIGRLNRKDRERWNLENRRCRRIITRGKNREKMKLIRRR